MSQISATTMRSRPIGVTIGDERSTNAYANPIAIARVEDDHQADVHTSMHERDVLNAVITMQRACRKRWVRTDSKVRASIPRVDIMETDDESEEWDWCLVFNCCPASPLKDQTAVKQSIVSSLLEYTLNVPRLGYYTHCRLEINESVAQKAVLGGEQVMVRVRAPEHMLLAEAELMEFPRELDPGPLRSAERNAAWLSYQASGHWPLSIIEDTKQVGLNNYVYSWL